jgi:hypothetical protein
MLKPFGLFASFKDVGNGLAFRPSNIETRSIVMLIFIDCFIYTPFKIVRNYDAKMGSMKSEKRAPKLTN